MKKSELLEKLARYPDDIEVCIMDWRKNSGEDDGEGNSSAGIYPVFKIGRIPEDVEEDDEETTPFLALEFENEDYDNDGNRIEVKE